MAVGNAWASIKFPITIGTGAANDNKILWIEARNSLFLLTPTPILIAFTVVTNLMNPHPSQQHAGHQNAV